MKHLARLLSLLILVSAGIFFASCGGGGGNDKTEEELQLDKLKGTWTLTESSVKFGGSTDDRFDGSALKLTIAGTYSAGGKYTYSLTTSKQVNASPWKGAGNWKFNPAAVSSNIIRLDSEFGDGSQDVSITYSLSSDAKTLTMDFTYSGTGYVLGARTESVSGDWTFVFTK
ncbi:hypothetical protein [Ohtaekwangia sp.]|uniref:hypothetical protein n=1 Tax=Ohtaekwangia sp. TaxID=2066019 RepID=UPI002F92AF92